MTIYKLLAVVRPRRWLSTMPYCTEHPFGQRKPAVLILFFPSSLDPFLRTALSVHNMLSRSYKHWCVISIAFLLEPTHCIIPDKLKKAGLSQLEMSHIYIAWAFCCVCLFILQLLLLGFFWVVLTMRFGSIRMYLVKGETVFVENFSQLQNCICLDDTDLPEHRLSSRSIFLSQRKMSDVVNFLLPDSFLAVGMHQLFQVSVCTLGITCFSLCLQVFQVAAYEEEARIALAVLDAVEGKTDDAFLAFEAMKNVVHTGILPRLVPSLHYPKCFLLLAFQLILINLNTVAQLWQRKADEFMNDGVLAEAQEVHKPCLQRKHCLMKIIDECSSDLSVADKVILALQLVWRDAVVLLTATLWHCFMPKPKSSYVGNTVMALSY